MEFKLAVKIILLVTLAIIILSSFVVIGVFLISPTSQNFTNVLLSVLLIIQLFMCVIIMHLHDVLTIKKR
ncbi:MAG: hypothetical protein QXF15_02340 [Candidatus Aenigmatarchaeota archaeon]|nr:hypothetical protein [Candidatus Aenigmarchaeota archaeon]